MPVAQQWGQAAPAAGPASAPCVKELGWQIGPLAHQRELPAAVADTQAFDEHMNLMLGDAEETHVTTEKDPTTGEELSKVRLACSRAHTSPVLAQARLPGARLASLLAWMRLTAWGSNLPLGPDCSMCQASAPADL